MTQATRTQEAAARARKGKTGNEPLTDKVSGPAETKREALRKIAIELSAIPIQRRASHALNERIEPNADTKLRLGREIAEILGTDDLAKSGHVLGRMISRLSSFPKAQIEETLVVIEKTIIAETATKGKIAYKMPNGKGEMEFTALDDLRMVTFSFMALQSGKRMEFRKAFITAVLDSPPEKQGALKMFCRNLEMAVAEIAAGSFDK